MPGRSRCGPTPRAARSTRRKIAGTPSSRISGTSTGESRASSLRPRSTSQETKQETDMIGYALGCFTVGVVWFRWPKLKAWASGGQAELVRDVKGEEAKLKEKL